MPLNIFISYAHEDETFKDTLLVHLKGLTRRKKILPWHDRLLKVGGDWRKQIQNALDTCQVALFLVSPDFIASDFIDSEEVARLLKRRETDHIHVIPIIIRPCDWQSERYETIQSLPKDGKAVIKFPVETGERDEVWVSITETIANLAAETQTTQCNFLTTYRTRLSSRFQRWDLAHTGAIQGGGATGELIEATLEQMYTPLRMGAGYNPNNLEEGQEITPALLLAREKPLVMRGMAGSGKTTWMRWTFCQFLADENVFPLFVELRTLAKTWQEIPRKKRSLDQFLVIDLTEHGLENAQTELQQRLADKDGPRPVLLVDGWDELGEMGEELRTKLMGFLKAYPRVLAVVSSRPYGEGRPSHSEGFDILDIQPLNNAEIEALTLRFYRHCYGQDETETQKSKDAFMTALNHSQSAQSLARTALLLTMMLIISRSHPLPDQRHKLYQVCIDSLLTALTKRREEQGVRIGPERWRPDNPDARLQAVAAMAFQIKQENKKQNSGPIVRRWEELERFLPTTWSHPERQGFLAWLAGPAGLLTDRNDDTLVFAHLSFQEFLTAWHLNATVEGDDNRSNTFLEQSRHPNWWETLRLWGALVESANPNRMQPVFEKLMQDESSGIWCAGAMMADGLGNGSFETWCHQAARLIAREWFGMADPCFRTRGASRQQEERKVGLQTALHNTAQQVHWLGWFRIERATRLANLSTPPHSKQTNASALLSALEEPTSPHQWAVGRILTGGPPNWPGLDDSEVMLLQLWPGHRRQAGLRLQSFVTLDHSRLSLETLARHTLHPPTPSKRNINQTRDWARDWARDWGRNWGRNLARDWASDLARYWASDLARNLAHYWTRNLARNWTRNLAHNLARNWARNLAHDWARDKARNWARNWGLDPNNPTHLDFTTVEFFSTGRMGPRFMLTNIQPENDLLTLFHHAAHVSYGRMEHTPQLESAVNQFQGDPLWPALARHIARCSSPEDRQLLTFLAQNPKERSGPLSWGLQYLVRGDVVLENGSEITLDALCDQLGMERLPYLEEMEPELDINWDED